MLVFFYILNATILILHEIESGYEKEWEILKIPVKLTGFIVAHTYIISFLLWSFLYYTVSANESHNINTYRKHWTNSVFSAQNHKKRKRAFQQNNFKHTDFRKHYYRNNSDNYRNK